MWPKKFASLYVHIHTCMFLWGVLPWTRKTRVPEKELLRRWQLCLTERQRALTYLAGPTHLNPSANPFLLLNLLFFLFHNTFFGSFQLYVRNHSHKRDSNVAKVLAQLFLTSVTWNYLVQVECKLECFSMLHCCLYVLWTVFGAGILCVFGRVVSLFVAIFWACSTVCLCLFWSLLFNEVLCDFDCACVHTAREKVWTGANPLGEHGAHTHRACP